MKSAEEGSAAVLTQVADRVLTITINRPDAMNAIDVAVSNGVATALQSGEDDPEVRVVVITGAGGRAFSAGADLRAFSRGNGAFDASGPYGEWGFGGCTKRTISKPVIAAVNGIAFGGGFEIVLAADLAVADVNATFALPEVRVGLIAGAGGLVRLHRQLPTKVAMDLILTGEPITAERAMALGLISRIAAPGAALQEAVALARTIADAAPLAVAASKSVVRRLAGGRFAAEVDAWVESDAAFARVAATDDAREGTAAFVERRSPRWAGR